MNKSEAVGGVNNAMDRLNTAVNLVDTAFGEIAERLSSVTVPPLPEPSVALDASSAGMPTPAKCELATRVEDRAFRLESIAKALRKLNDTLDI